MTNNYTAKDIVEMAVQSKARGVELYMALAHNSANYHVSKLFVEFAKDEQRHKHDLEKWLDYLKENNPEEAYPGERSLYLKALVDSNTYNCDKVKMQALEKTISEEDAVQAGINFEKDFMLFLHDLRIHTGDSGEKTVDSLLEDETRHLREMFQLKDKLVKG